MLTAERWTFFASFKTAAVFITATHTRFYLKLRAVTPKGLCGGLAASRRDFIGIYGIYIERALPFNPSTCSLSRLDRFVRRRFSLSCILLRGGKLLKKSESVIEYNIELSVYAAKAAIYAPGGFYERQSDKHSFNADFKCDGYRHACL